VKDEQHSKRHNSLFQLTWYIQWAERRLYVALSSVVWRHSVQCLPAFCKERSGGLKISVKVWWQ